MRNKKWLGNGLLILTASIWGTAFVAQRAGMDSIEPLTFNTARMVLAAVMLTPLAFILRGARRAPVTASERGATLKGGLLCGIFLSGGSIFQQMGLVETSAGKAGFITALYILLVPVIAALFLKRRTAPTVWVAVALGVVGMYLLCITDALTLERGDALVCVCALFYTGHILCADRFSGRGDPVMISAIQFAVAAVVSGIPALVFETPDANKLLSAAVPIVYCGIVSGGIGYTLQLVGQRYTDPASASIIMSTEAVFAVIAGALVLQERLTARELLGCAVMLAAVILVQWPNKEKKGAENL